MRAIQAVLIVVIGITLIVLAYHWSGAAWRETQANTNRMNQHYRCIIANGRSLRGATTTDCRPFTENP